ncbi:hypothetical protein TNCV_615521 [Trichonephila clavipes]|nr:hypothetical protein TNCV_615521 [Trichonephila clavipes]
MAHAKLIHSLALRTAVSGITHYHVRVKSLRNLQKLLGPVVFRHIPYLTRLNQIQCKWEAQGIIDKTKKMQKVFPIDFEKCGTAGKRPELQFQLYYLRRGEISGIEVFLQLLDTSYVRATRELEKKGRIFPYFSKMYKNALKEDLIRVVEDLDGTVESTDTIAKLKTKIENSSTFESDPDFVKTLIKNCIDERVSRNEREVTLEEQKIELAKLQLTKLEKEIANFKRLKKKH